MIPMWIWWLHHLCLVLVMVGAFWMILKKERLFVASCQVILLLPTVFTIFFVKSLGRPQTIHEIVWLRQASLQGEVWAWFVIAGYMYAVYYIGRFLWIIKSQKKAG